MSCLFSDADFSACLAPQDQKSSAESTSEHNSATEEGNDGKMEYGMGERTLVMAWVTELPHQEVAG